jgi:hypothetical protein
MSRARCNSKERSFLQVMTCLPKSALDDPAKHLNELKTGRASVTNIQTR